MESSGEILKEKTYTTFDGKYEVIKKLGAGRTSRVYLCRLINMHKKKFALKIFRNEYLEDKEYAHT